MVLKAIVAGLGGEEAAPQPSKADPKEQNWDEFKTTFQAMGGEVVKRKKGEFF